jgi:hypothetical protein
MLALTQGLRSVHDDRTDGVWRMEDESRRMKVRGWRLEARGWRMKGSYRRLRG